MRRFLRDESGGITVEFVLLFPFFLLVFFSALEGGLLMTRSVMLDRGLDIAVRDLRLGTPTPPDFETFRARVCDVAGVIPDCMSNLQIELVRVTADDWSPLSDEVRCIDRAEEINPLDVTNFEVGLDNQMMMVRACALIDPLAPSIGLGAALPKDASGAFALVSTSAFVNEPRS